MDVENLRTRLGGLASVSFVCGFVSRKRGFTFLETKDRKFALLIPDSERTRFAGIDFQALSGTDLTAWGFLEDFRGQVQIVAVSLDQLVFKAGNRGYRTESSLGI